MSCERTSIHVCCCSVSAVWDYNRRVRRGNIFTYHPGGTPPRWHAVRWKVRSVWNFHWPHWTLGISVLLAERSHVAAPKVNVCISVFMFLHEKKLCVSFSYCRVSCLIFYWKSLLWHHDKSHFFLQVQLRSTWSKLPVWILIFTNSLGRKAFSNRTNVKTFHKWDKNLITCTA